MRFCAEYCNPLNLRASFIFAIFAGCRLSKRENMGRKYCAFITQITITCSSSIFTGPQNAKFKGSEYVSTKKPQDKRARENLGVYMQKFGGLQYQWSFRKRGKT